MIKLIGFIIIVLSCGKIGIDLSQKYCNRTKELKSFIHLLERIKSDISFSNCTITDALSKNIENKNNVISSMILSILNSVNENSVALEDAFNTYINKNGDNISLQRKDIEEINGFFSMFGIGDREDEINNLNNTINNLKIFLQDALEDEKKYVRLFRTTGVLAGFLIAIILA